MRVRGQATPTRIQMEAVECGAVALAIVLEHHGQYRSIEELRQACGVSRDGVSAGSLLRAARAHGFEAHGVRCEADAIEELPLPAILHWEFNHFVVLDAVRDDQVYLNDPAIGPRRVTRAEFDRAFTGVALTLEPGADFVRTGSRPSLLAVAGAQTSRVRPAVLFGLLVAVAMLVPQLLAANFSGVFVDRVLVEGNGDWLWAFVATMVVVALLRAWTTWHREQMMLRAQTRLGAGGALGFMWHAMTLPVSFFTHRYSAEVANRIPLADAVAGVVVHQVIGAGIGLVTMIVYGAVMAQYDASLTALAFGFALLSTSAMVVSQRVLADGHRQVLVEEARLAGAANRGIATLEAATAAGAGDALFARMLARHASVIGRRQKLQRATLVLQAMQQGLASLALVAIVIDGGHAVMDGLATVGMMIAFQSLMHLFAAPVAGLVGAGAAMQDMRGNAERLDDVLRHPVDPMFVRDPALKNTSASPRAAADARPGRVEFRGVSFRYGPQGAAVVEGLDVVIEPGTAVIITGASGSGKSTIARLLAGHQHPLAGEILLDGVLLAALPRTERFDRIAHVDQDIHLLSGTVADNIHLWRTDVPTHVVQAAAADAAIADVIERRRGGYAGPVAEEGRNLSGGERQRLELARALAIGAEVLVLDEATSALDAETERAVLERLVDGRRTVFFISHRLATADLFDRAIVIESGRIVQDGRPQELAAAPGPWQSFMEHRG